MNSAPVADLAALRATSIAKSLGAARPISSEPGAGGEIIHRFDVADGPIFSAYEDSVIADAFLMIGRAAFKAELLDETGKIVSAHGDRAHRLLIDGQQHTTASDIHTTMVNGVTNGQWLGFMLAGDARWVDTLQ